MSFVIQAQISFTASVNKNKVGVNEQFSITFTVNGSGDKFQAPLFSDFTVLTGPSTSSSTTIINGKVSNENSYTYYLRAKKVGLFTIGSASIRVNGKQYQSSTTSIQVLKSSPKNNTNNTPLAKAKENVFIELLLISCIKEAIVEESIPPERKHPIGTSEFNILFLIESFSIFSTKLQCSSRVRLDKLDSSLKIFLRSQ